VREAGDFAHGHVRGALNIGLDGKFATWAGTVLSLDRPIVIIAGPGRHEEAAIRLGRIGFDRVAGYLDTGMQAVEGREDLLVRTERVTASAIARELTATNPPFVLDVRTPQEWQTRHIVGSVNIPLNHLGERISELPRDRRIVVHCASGYRSSIAFSMLQRAGFDDLVELAGGMAAWEAAKLPVDGERHAA
jgi:rhodanese-related sulfurtransferase